MALAVIVLACLYAAYRPPRLWLAISLGFAALTLGPFVHVFGINTYIPTPWTLLRYVPVIGAARMPPRFAIVVMLGVAVMFAAALVALTERYPRQRRRMLLAVSLCAAFELLGAPRPLFSAAVPDVYATIAADRRDVRVLDLPFGIIDGLGGLATSTPPPGPTRRSTRSRCSAGISRACRTARRTSIRARRSCTR